jgi:aryl-alcohol dehydrogenase-like predicted oxidoreductase
METEFREESLVMAQQIKAHAEKRGMTAAQFALNWVRNNALVTSVLAGPRTEEQWQEYLGCARVQAHRRRRSADRRPGQARPSVDARLQRSEISLCWDALARA